MATGVREREKERKDERCREWIVIAVRKKTKGRINTGKKKGTDKRGYTFQLRCEGLRAHLLVWYSQKDITTSAPSSFS